MKRFSKVRLECQPLEDRVTPAGNVTTSLVAGTLTLTGVDVPTQWGINHQVFLVANIGGGVIEVSGQNGTTVAGGANKQFTDVKALTIKTGLGSDTVTLFGLTLTGPLSINQGSGDNVVNFTGGGSYASASITNGQGFDTLNIGTGNGSTYTFAGAVSISNGSGESTALIGKSGLDNVTLNSLNVTAGDGLDTFFADGQSLAVNGNTSFANGTGGSDIRLTAKNVTLGGAMTINNGVGNNLVSLGKSAVGTTFSSKAITITGNNGIGNVGLFAETATITGNMSVTGKTGVDSFTVNGSNFVKTCKIVGNLTLNYGTGDSDVQLEAANTMSVTGAVSITNLAGLDSIVLGRLGTNVELGSLKIANGNGDAAVLFVGDTTIVGELNISGGDGHDQVTTQAALFKVGGATKVNLGSGGCLVTLAATEETLFGNASFTATDGTDEIDMGSGASTTTAKSLNFSLGNGPAEVHVEHSSTGAISFAGGTDDDLLGIGSLAPVVSVGSINFTGGPGKDTLLVGEFASSNVTVNGAVTFSGGDNRDRLVFAHAAVTGIVTATTGAGIDLVAIDDSTFNSAVTIDTGSDRDSVNIEFSLNNGVTTKFNTDLTIKLGSGDDFAVLDPNSDDGVTVVGKLTVDGGLELDWLDQGATVSLGVPLVLTGCEISS